MAGSIYPPENKRIKPLLRKKGLCYPCLGIIRELLCHQKPVKFLFF